MFYLLIKLAFNQTDEDRSILLQGYTVIAKIHVTTIVLQVQKLMHLVITSWSWCCINPSKTIQQGKFWTTADHYQLDQYQYVDESQASVFLNTDLNIMVPTLASGPLIVTGS